MVYRRRSRRRRFRRSRRVARKVKRYVRRAIGRTVETKQIAYRLSTIWNAIATSWVEKDLLEGVTQGVGGSQFIGKKITIKSIQLRGTLCEGATGLPNDDMYNVVRIVLASWRNSQNLTPCSQIGYTLDDPIVKMGPGANSLGKKYVDKIIPMNSNGVERAGGDGYVPTIRYVRFYKKLNLPIKFGSDATTYPTNRLVLSMLSDSAVAVNPGFIQGFVRVTYTDA